MGGWLGSRVVSVLDSGAEGPRFKSQSQRCQVTVIYTTMAVFSSKQALQLFHVKVLGGNCSKYFPPAFINKR